MKVLQVIHGFPPRYNAGSEVYTQTLAHGLAKNHNVYVFTRQENMFLPEYAMTEECDPLDARIELHIINMARGRDGYSHEEVDTQFGNILERIDPDIVHIGHLNHLSTSLVFEANKRNMPIIFTLHDYWLMCPRGQFIQMYPENPADLWALCDGQGHSKCAERCYQRYFAGHDGKVNGDLAHWTSWVQNRMEHVHEVCKMVDMFIAPSRYLMRRFTDDFGIPSDKITYVDYGFDLTRLVDRKRIKGEPFTFGYIGTHIPAKGIHHLIEAFGIIEGPAILRIWGRHRGVETENLKAFANALPDAKQHSIKWMDEYRNQEIVNDVFNQCDTIVVPSIWAENSPLVIHEALQTRVPVITANYGGMSEYIEHEVNGLLFAHRDPVSLAAQMQRFVDNPEYAKQLAKRGYILSEDGNIPSTKQHVKTVEELYDHVLSTRI
jgi:glycosyltransferase involved in cell wall biosynthesis